ncbi:MAG: hypothetical protein Q4D16_18705 [Eubacteriales bacterium]|nr:hypothetical protein [Eubacteriales bacterium]
MNRQIKGAFDQVQAEETLKAQTKEVMLAEFSGKQREVSGVRRRRMGMWAVRYGFAIACLVLLVTAGILKNSVNAQAAYIRLEGNVAVGLALDENDVVIEVQGLNKEGQQVLDEIDVMGMSYREAVDCIMSRSTGFESGAVRTKTQVSVEGQDTEKCRRMEEEVSEQCANHEKRHRQQNREEDGTKTNGENENETGADQHGHGNNGRHNGRGRHSGNGGHD